MSPISDPLLLEFKNCGTDMEVKDGKKTKEIPLYNAVNV
jgi:hypothetical protein